MKLNWYEEVTEAYEAVVWEQGNTCLVDEYYTTKVEAVKAVKTFKANYTGSEELDCFVRYFDYQDGTVEDYNL